MHIPIFRNSGKISRNKRSRSQEVPVAPDMRTIARLLLSRSRRSQPTRSDRMYKIASDELVSMTMGMRIFLFSYLGSESRSKRVREAQRIAAACGM